MTFWSSYSPLTVVLSLGITVAIILAIGMLHRSFVSVDKTILLWIIALKRGCLCFPNLTFLAGRRSIQGRYYRKCF